MGLADFADSNSNGWPTGPVSTKNRNWENYMKRETSGLFRAVHPVLIEKIETGPVGHRLQLRACKIDQSHY